jgi:hypothetical protein
MRAMNAAQKAAKTESKSTKIETERENDDKGGKPQKQDKKQTQGRKLFIHPTPPYFVSHPTPEKCK